MAGEGRDVLQLPVTNTRTDVCCVLEENYGEGMQASLGPASPRIQYLKALVESAPAGFVHVREAGMMGGDKGGEREGVLPNPT